MSMFGFGGATFGGVAGFGSAAVVNPVRCAVAKPAANTKARRKYFIAKLQGGDVGRAGVYHT
jgi:hypothetical protein